MSRQPRAFALTRDRAPYRAGQWLARATFNWALKRADGAGTALVVTLDDMVQPQTSALDLRSTGTLIHLSRADLETQSATESVESGSASEEPARQESQEEHGPVPEPPAAQLGVPKYPGARYDAQMSSQLSSSDRWFYVYTTTDALQRVVAFYERSTGKKGQPAPDGVSIAIAVKGTMPWPELGVMVQPRLPQYPASVKAVISVTRARS